MWVCGVGVRLSAVSLVEHVTRGGENEKIKREKVVKVSAKKALNKCEVENGLSENGLSYIMLTCKAISNQFLVHGKIK